ncbi:MAG: DUF4381 domain-containing protein [bacterium]
MNPQQADPLAQLRDIHSMAEPSWWPLTPAWWILIALSVYILYLLWKQYKARVNRRLPYKRALVELNSIFSQWQASHDDRNYLSDVSLVLKKVAIYHSGRAEVASLHSEQWLDYLKQTIPGSMNTELLNALGDLRFRKNINVEVAKLQQLLVQWLKLQAKSSKVRKD